MKAVQLILCFFIINSCSNDNEPDIRNENNLCSEGTTIHLNIDHLEEEEVTPYALRLETGEWKYVSYEEFNDFSNKVEEISIEPEVEEPKPTPKPKPEPKPEVIETEELISVEEVEIIHPDIIDPNPYDNSWLPEQTPSIDLCSDVRLECYEAGNPCNPYGRYIIPTCKAFKVVTKSCKYLLR